MSLEYLVSRTRGRACETCLPLEQSFTCRSREPFPLMGQGCCHVYVFFNKGWQLTLRLLALDAAWGQHVPLC